MKSQNLIRASREVKSQKFLCTSREVKSQFFLRASRKVKSSPLRSVDLKQRVSQLCMNKTELKINKPKLKIEIELAWNRSSNDTKQNL